MARKFEYKIVNNVDAREAEKVLQTLSGEDWEVVDMDWADHGLTGTFLLKRSPIAQSQTNVGGKKLTD